MFNLRQWNQKINVINHGNLMLIGFLSIVTLGMDLDAIVSPIPRNTCINFNQKIRNACLTRSGMQKQVQEQEVRSHVECALKGQPEVFHIPHGFKLRGHGLELKHYNGVT